jgi:anhydro-N-acetylmuramic acid kinase
VIAFDTGPANMVVDQLAQRLFGMAYDSGGSIAAKSDPNVDVLRWLLKDDYYGLMPPKSTGREHYGSHFVDALCHEFTMTLGVEDDWTDSEKSVVLATATALTAHSVAAGIATFSASAGTAEPVARVIVAGGGTMNETLMSMVAACVTPAVVEPIDEYGIRSSDKEALCFAVLAHELLNGTPTGMPSVTGASRPAMQGKICLP